MRMIVLLLTINISVQVARRRLRKKQIRAARMKVPTSGMANAIQIAHIHAMRNSSETNAYSSPSGPMNANKKLPSIQSNQSSSVLWSFSCLQTISSPNKMPTNVLSSIRIVIYWLDRNHYVRLISQYLTTNPFLMCDVMNKNVSFEPTAAISTTANTKMNVNSFKHFLNVSKRLLSTADPDDCGGGGSWNESHSIWSFDEPL